MKISEGFDLTEKNQESKRNFHLFVESANVGIIVTQNVQFKYINQAMLDLVGYSVQEIMAHSFWEIAHEDYREGIKCNYLRRISGESLDHISIVKICRKDKSIK